MSLISGFANQTITYTPRAETDPRTGEPVYGEPEERRARYVEKQRLVRDAAGSQIVADTEVLMVEEPAIGAQIEGREVLARESIVAKNGQILGWKALL